MKTARISGISWVMAAAAGAMGVPAAAGAPPILPIERLGFFDADHSRASDNMSQSSLIIGTAATRWVMGVSSRYYGFGSDGGLSAWVYHPSAGTRRVGLFDADHVRSDGYQFAELPEPVGRGGGVVVQVSRPGAGGRQRVGLSAVA